MGTYKLHGKDLSAYADIDIEALLGELTEEQIEELGRDLIDPDDTHIPPSERCAYKTDKQPTGPFDRKKLIEFLEKKAKEEKDWEEIKPYVKEIRGKVWKPKEEEKIQLNDDETVDTEWDEVLATATEEELVDLAAILGFHGMLNQVQYHNAFVAADAEEEKDKAGGFQGVAKHQNFKLFEDEAPNETDVEGCLKQLQDNDPKLKEVNLNNIKKISIDTLKQYGKALKTNTHLEKLHMANTRATDRVVKAIAESLTENKTLKLLNLESNYIKGDAIVELLKAINVNKTVTELRICNQRPALLGNKVETKIANLIMENGTMLKFGIFLEVPDARVRVREYMKRNQDNLRKARRGEAIGELPKREKTPERRRTEVVPEKSKPAQSKPPPKKEESEEESSEEESSEEESDEE